MGTKPKFSQVMVIGRVQPQTWEDYRRGCHDNFNGGHHEREVNEAFHHGMDTVFNLLESEFPPAEKIREWEAIIDSVKPNKD